MAYGEFKDLKKVHSSCIDNIWGADLINLKLISKLKKGFRFLLSVIDIYSKMHGLFL